MKRRFILTLIGTLVLSLLQVPHVIADQLFHSERLDFWRTDDGEAAGHPELRSGHVVDIHPNGPVNGALERYMINGAAPKSSYKWFSRSFLISGVQGIRFSPPLFLQPFSKRMAEAMHTADGTLAAPTLAASVGSSEEFSGHW